MKYGCKIHKIWKIISVLVKEYDCSEDKLFGL